MGGVTVHAALQAAARDLLARLDAAGLALVAQRDLFLSDAHGATGADGRCVYMILCLARKDGPWHLIAVAPPNPPRFDLLWAWLVRRIDQVESGAAVPWELGLLDEDVGGPLDDWLRRLNGGTRGRVLPLRPAPAGEEAP